MKKHIVGVVTQVPADHVGLIDGNDRCMTRPLQEYGLVPKQQHETRKGRTTMQYNCGRPHCRTVLPTVRGTRAGSLQERSGVPLPRPPTTQRPVAGFCTSNASPKRRPLGPPNLAAAFLRVPCATCPLAGRCAVQEPPPKRSVLRLATLSYQGRLMPLQPLLPLRCAFLSKHSTMVQPKWPVAMPPGGGECAMTTTPPPPPPLVCRAPRSTAPSCRQSRQPGRRMWSPRSIPNSRRPIWGPVVHPSLPSRLG